MAKVTIVVIAVLFLLHSLGLADAQPNETTVENATDVVDQLDANTQLLEETYDSSTQTVELTFRSTAAQQITVTDGGALWEGKEIEHRSVVMQPGQTKTLEVPVTPLDRGALQSDMIGVAIETDSVETGHLVQTDDYLFDGPWSSTDAQITGAAGAIAAITVLIVFAFIRVRRDSTGVERVQ